MPKVLDIIQALTQLAAGFGQGLQEQELRRIAQARLLGEPEVLDPEEAANIRAGRTLLQRLFGTGLGQGVVDVGGTLARFGGGVTLTPEVLQSLRLTQKVSRPGPSMLEQATRTVPISPLGDFEIAGELGALSPAGREAILQPTMVTTQEPIPGLVGRKLTRKEFITLKVEQARAERRDAEAEQNRTLSAAKSIMSDLGDRKIPLAPGFLQRLLSAKTMKNLANIIADAPPEQRVSVTVKGQPFELSLREYFDYLQRDEANRRADIADKRLEATLKSAALQQERLNLAMQQFERGPLSAAERQAREKLGLPTTAPLSTDQAEAVEQAMFEARAKTARIVTGAQELAKEPGRERALERQKELKLTQPLSREQSLAAKALGIPAKSVEDLSPEQAQQIRTDLRAFRMDDFISRAEVQAGLLGQRQRARRHSDLTFNLTQSSVVINEMQAAWDTLNKAGLASLTGIRSALNLMRLTEGFSGQLSRLGGDRGILSNQDISRAMNLVPSPFITAKVIGDDAFAQLKRILSFWSTGINEIYGQKSAANGPSALEVLRKELESR